MKAIRYAVLLNLMCFCGVYEAFRDNKLFIIDVCYG